MPKLHIKEDEIPRKKLHNKVRNTKNTEKETEH